MNEDLLEQVRGEREYYMAAHVDDEIQTPFTRDGFEALLEVICAKKEGFKLPEPNDGLRATLAAYLHHIDPLGGNVLTISKAMRALHRSVSNRATWAIDQEIKAKARAHVEKMQREAELVKKPRNRAQRRALAALRTRQEGQAQVPVALPNEVA